MCPVQSCLLATDRPCRTNAEDPATHHSSPRRGPGRQADPGNKDPCRRLDQRAVQAQPGLRLRLRRPGGGGIAAHSLYPPPLGDKQGYVPLFAHWEQEELQADKNAIPKQFTFHLPKGTTIGGVVKDEDGGPIAARRSGCGAGGASEEERVRSPIGWPTARTRESPTPRDAGRSIMSPPATTSKCS